MEGVDVVVVAGDVCPFNNVVVEEMARKWRGSEIVYVPGNHEFYGDEMTIVEGDMEVFCREAGIHLLNRRAVVINGVRFVGATLWTDFRLYAGVDDVAVLAAMIRARNSINDYKGYILHEGVRLTPWTTARMHEADKEFIKTTLAEAKPTNIPSVVVTHHAPSARSIHHRFLGDGINPAFASNLDDVVADGRAVFWFHGHMHDSVQYEVGETMVMSNPYGYSPSENRVGFNPRFNVEINV